MFAKIAAAIKVLFGKAEVVAQADANAAYAAFTAAVTEAEKQKPALEAAGKAALDAVIAAAEAELRARGL